MSRPTTVTVSPDALVRLEAIAIDAGKAAMAHYQTDLVVQQKGDKGPVTAADHAAHATIVAALTAWDPSLPIVSEEGEIPGPAVRATWSRFWLVDPLDGT